MKKIVALVMLALLPLTVNLRAFIDQDQVDKEEVMRLLNELKVVKGILFTGRAWIYLDPVWGSGPAFDVMSKKMGFNPQMSLLMEMTAFPMPMVELGSRLRFIHSQRGGTQLLGENLYADFILFQFIRFRIGQCSEKFTPFTLQSSVDQVWMRSELFNAYYQEDLYAKLIPTDGSVPFEGLKMKFDLAMGQDATVGLKAIAAKVLNDSQKGNSYDRYLAGLYLNGQAMKKAVGVEVASIMFADYTNSGRRDGNLPKFYWTTSGTVTVNTAPLMGIPLFDVLGIEGEAAVSGHKANVSSTNHMTWGTAYQANLTASIPKMLKLKAGYRQIAYEFVSPGAQTRYITPGVSGSQFQNEDFYVSLGLAPFWFQDYFRNKIQFTRDYFDWLNTAYPMNVATPNRQGLFGDIKFNYMEMLSLAGNASMMQEVRPTAKPNENVRSFLRVVAEGSLNLSKIANIQGLPKISGFYIMENDDREDSALTSEDETENYKIRILGVEAVFDLKVLKIIGMYQSFGITGRKIIDVYNPAQQDALKIAGYQIYDFGTTGIVDSVMGGGFIVRVSQAVSMQIDGFLMSNDDSYKFLQARCLIDSRF